VRLRRGAESRIPGWLDQAQGQGIAALSPIEPWAVRVAPLSDIHLPSEEEPDAMNVVFRPYYREKFAAGQWRPAGFHVPAYG